MVLFHNNMAQDQQTATSPITVTPLWGNESLTDTQPCIFVERNASQGVSLLHGSAHHTCSIQINASLGYYTSIEIPNGNVSSESFFSLYIGRQGELGICTNKYLVINKNPNMCSTVLLHNSVHLNLQGNVSISVTGISALESNPVCPESNNSLCFDSWVNQTQNSRNVKGYTDHIDCSFNRWWIIDFCYIEFPSNCYYASLYSHREVVLECYNHDLNQTKTSFIVYTVGITGLDLGYIGIVKMEGRPFQGLEYVRRLYLDDNNLAILHEGVFIGLSMLSHLSIRKNELVQVDEDSFKGLVMLSYLDLSGNRLTTLPVGLSRNMIHLELRNNQIVALNANVVENGTELKYLFLDRNNLTSLPDQLFHKMNKLHQLDLSINKLDTLHSHQFNNLNTLSYLDISRNRLDTLPTGVFSMLTNLQRLALDYNKLVTLPNGLFNVLTSLKYLNLQYNELVTLPYDIFKNHDEHVNMTLFELYLSFNKLITLPNGVFNGLTDLVRLELMHNEDVIFSNNMLKGMIRLYRLHLNNNGLTHIDMNIFNDTINIQHVDLSENQLTQCPSIKYLTKLRSLDIRGNPLTATTRDIFKDLRATSLTVIASQHEICECYVPDGVTCLPYSDRSPYITCDRLLSDRAIVVMMWIIGINALGGNVFVLVWRKIKTENYKVQDLLLSNLAMSDSLMGFYMLIIACADIYYGNYFPIQSESWRSGVTCRVAGSISITSTQLSVFFLTLISIDRFIGIKYPYSDKRLGKRSTIVTAVIIWICSITLGVVPSVLSGWNFKFYDNSHVCIGLPLALYKTHEFKPHILFAELSETRFTGYAHGLYFSTALFLGLNGLCYLIILGCYIEIFRAQRKSATDSGRTPDKDEQMRLTRKIIAIVATDFICVFPLIVLGILVQTRLIELPASVYAWSVTVILPINSAINPYLYTIAEIISNKRKKKADKNIPHTIAMRRK